MHENCDATGPWNRTKYVYDAAGQLTAEYTSAAAVASPCGTCYLTADNLGSTRMVTDETATPRECHDFLPFGEEITRTVGCYGGTTSNTLKFTGKERDVETGNDYFGARYLSGTQMRWTIPDWSARGEAVPYASLADPQTLNLYAYVRNSPLSRLDLDGPYPLDACVGQAPEYSKESTYYVEQLTAFYRDNPKLRNVLIRDLLGYMANKPGLTAPEIRDTLKRLAAE